MDKTESPLWYSDLRAIIAARTPVHGLCIVLGNFFAQPLNGELPTAAQFSAFQSRVADARTLPPACLPM